MIYQNINNNKQFNVNDFKKEIINFIIDYNIEECDLINDALTKYLDSNTALKTSDPGLYDELILLQKECRWIGLPFLIHGHVLDCFRNINIAWEIPKKYNYPVIESDDYYYQKEIISGNLDKFIRKILIDKRDQFKNLLMEVLRSSDEIISRTRLISNNTSLKPTLANWFSEYFNEVGSGVLNKLKMAQFFSENKNFQKLDMSEKNKLREIFNIYERIKLSSFNPLGREDRIPFHDGKGIGYIQRGEVIRYSDKEINDVRVKLSLAEDILIKYGLKDKKDFIITKSDQKIIDNKKDKNKPMISDIPQYKPTSQSAGLKHDVYGSEDEKEIEQHRYSGLKKDKSLDINAILAELKEKMELMFKAPEEEMQFNNLCSSYLKGIRDEMEFIGMLDYKTEMAEKIVEFLKKYRPAMPVKKQAVVKTLHATSLPKVPTYSQAQNIMQKSVAAAPMRPVGTVQRAVQAPVSAPPKPTYMPQLKRMESTKPVIQDIKVPAKDIRLIGPVEELGSFTLAKFRRLADTPVEAAEKIKEKVDLLEEQSIPAKAKGIVAFKNSPLNRIYLRIGNASIDQGRSVAEIISELSQKGQEYLTKEEFDCIADLNKKLRF